MILSAALQYLHPGTGHPAFISLRMSGGSSLIHFSSFFGMGSRSLSLPKTYLSSSFLPISTSLNGEETELRAEPLHD